MGLAHSNVTRPGHELEGCAAHASSANVLLRRVAILRLPVIAVLQKKQFPAGGIWQLDGGRCLSHSGELFFARHQVQILVGRVSTHCYPQVSNFLVLVPGQVPVLVLIFVLVLVQYPVGQILLYVPRGKHLL
jgi:hypothetical protein